VLMVGDSLVFGYGVEGHEALPVATERELRARSLTATVGNAGVPSFGTSHAVARMAELDVPFAADAFVVCGFLGNDAIDEVLSLRVVDAGLLHQGTMAKLVRTSWRTRLALRSRAWLWLEAWIAVNAPEHSPLHQTTPDPDDVARTAGLPPEPHQHAGLFLDVADREWTWQPGTAPVVPRLLGYLRTALTQAKAVAGARPLVFVVLPTSWQVDETKRVRHLREFGFDPALYPRGTAQQRWLAVADLGIPAFDATPVLAAEPDVAALYLPDGGHFSVRGNAVVGKWLAEQLAAFLR
jgi:lysophospholipase L1-like esterase